MSKTMFSKKCVQSQSAIRFAGSWETRGLFRGGLSLRDGHPEYRDFTDIHEAIRSAAFRKVELHSVCHNGFKIHGDGIGA